MRLSDLLDETITEPAPPFPGVDAIIGRERRRARARRFGTAIGSAAAALAVVLGAQALLGTANAPGPAEPTPGVLTSTATPPETPEQRYARMSDALLTQLSALAPGSVVNPHDPATSLGMTDGRFVAGPETFPGYDYARSLLTFTTPNGGGILDVVVVRRTGPAPAPTAFVLNRVFGGCAGWVAMDRDGRALQPQEYDCASQQRSDSTATYGWIATGLWRYHFATVVHRDGTGVAVVASSPRPEGPALSIEHVVTLASDPAFAR